MNDDWLDTHYCSLLFATIFRERTASQPPRAPIDCCILLHCFGLSLSSFFFCYIGFFISRPRRRFAKRRASKDAFFERWRPRFWRLGALFWRRPPSLAYISRGRSSPAHTWRSRDAPPIGHIILDRAKRMMSRYILYRRRYRAQSAICDPPGLS